MRIDNGTYTVTNPAGARRTIRIRTKLPQHTRNPDFVGRRLVEILTGPDNTSDYVGIGWLNEAPYARLAPFGKSNPRHVATIQTILNLFGEPREGYEVLASTTCRRCNRVLTVPDSIKSGLGPECANRA